MRWFTDANGAITSWREPALSELCNDPDWEVIDILRPHAQEPLPEHQFYAKHVAPDAAEAGMRKHCSVQREKQKVAAEARAASSAAKESAASAKVETNAIADAVSLLNGLLASGQVRFNSETGTFEAAGSSGSSPSTAVPPPPGLERDSDSSGSRLNESLPYDTKTKDFQQSSVVFTEQAPFEHVRATLSDPVPPVGAFIQTAEEQKRLLDKWFVSEDPNALSHACNIDLGLLEQRPEYKTFLQYMLTWRTAVEVYSEDQQASWQGNDVHGEYDILRCVGKFSAPSNCSGIEAPSGRVKGAVNEAVQELKNSEEFMLLPDAAATIKDPESSLEYAQPPTVPQPSRSLSLASVPDRSSQRLHQRTSED